MYRILYIAISFLLIFSCFEAKENALCPEKHISSDSAIIHKNQAYLALSNDLIKTDFTHEKFYQTQISLKNTGDSTLIIDKIIGSCQCASTTILKSRIPAADSGKVLININMSGVSADNNIVEYYILSNAKNSPVSFRVEFETK